VADTLASGRRFRILTQVDDFSPECLGLNQTPQHPQVFWRKIFASFNHTGLGPNLIALAAIDVALWDHYAKQRNDGLSSTDDRSDPAKPAMIA
jgi:L-alanine-DL-glutamate epimerase-like enolase superfamily enzyme